MEILQDEPSHTWSLTNYPMTSVLQADNEKLLKTFKQENDISDLHFKKITSDCCIASVSAGRNAGRTLGRLAVEELFLLGQVGDVGDVLQQGADRKGQKLVHWTWASRDRASSSSC